MSQARRLRRQQEREQDRAPVLNKANGAHLVALSDDQLSSIKAEIERYRQEAYEQGYKSGYKQGRMTGYNLGHKEGYSSGWEEARNKMVRNAVHWVIAVGLKCIKDDWGKFAFKKKQERTKYFYIALADRFTEYFADGLKDKEKKAELEKILLDTEFIYEDKQNKGGQEGAGRSENSP